MGMKSTLVINAKGGVGKTTITTNLASYFASRGIPTTIADYDPQSSSLNWLAQRSAELPTIHGADLAVRAGLALQNGRRQIPLATRQLIIDAPAGPSRLLLQDLMQRTQSVLIPVAPSAIDIHATANFVRDLLLIGRLRSRNIRLGVVANRVRRASPVYQPLERFLGSLGLPFLTRLSDSEVFVLAAESGVGIFEMDPLASAAEREQFMPIVEWADPDHRLRAENKIIELSRPSWVRSG